MDQDDIFVYPTDTVWGIGGSIFSNLSFNKISKIKGTDLSKPVSILFSGAASLKKFCHFPFSWDEEKVNIFFSMETTLLIHRSCLLKEIPDWNFGNSDFVGVRLLPYPFLVDLTEKLGGPITTTSLNISGSPSIVTTRSALEFYEKYLEGSNSSFFKSSDVSLSGSASTICKFYEGEFSILRKGRLSRQVEKILGL